MAITPDAATAVTSGATPPQPTDNTPAQTQAPATTPAQPTATAAPAQAQAPTSATTQSGMPGVPTAATASVADAHPTSVLRGILMGALGAAAKVGKGVGNELKIISEGGHVQAANTKIAQQGEIARQQQQAQASKDAAQKAADESRAAGDIHSEQPLRMSILTNTSIGGAILNSTNLQSLNQTARDNFMKNNTEDAYVAQLFKDEGVPLAEDHGAGFDNLGPQHAAELAPGTNTVALNNGQLGENHGIYIANIATANKTPLSKDRQVTVGWDVDPKTGVMTPRTQTLHAGTDTLGSVLTARFNAQQEFAEKSKIADQIEKQNTNAADVNEKNTAAQKNLAEGREKDAAAALERQQVNGGGNGLGPDGKPLPASKELTDAIAALPPSGQQAVAGMNPQQQAYWIRAAHGYVDPKDFSTSIRKGGLGMTRQAADEKLLAINPNFSDDLYSTMQKTRQAYSGNGKEGQAIRSFNQFLVHGQELKHVSDSLSRSNSPALNAPLNEVRTKYFGQPGVPELMTAVEAARREWQSFIDSGYSPDEAQNQRASVLMSDHSSPSMIMGVLGVMGNQAVGRLDQLNEGYKTAVNGEDYPNLITPSGRAAAQELGMGDSIKQYQTGGHFGGGNAAPTVLIGGKTYPLNPDGTLTVGGYMYKPKADGTGADLIGPVKK